MEAWKRGSVEDDGKCVHVARRRLRRHLERLARRRALTGRFATAYDSGMSRKSSAPSLSLTSASTDDVPQESQNVLAPCPRCGDALEAPPSLVTLATGDELVCLRCTRRRRGRASAEQIRAVREFMLTPPDLLMRVLREMGK